MKARRDMLKMRYWWKLMNMGRERLPRKVYEWELRRKETAQIGYRTWTTHTEKLLTEIGLETYWHSQNVNIKQEEWNRIVGERIHDREQRIWRKSVCERPKLRTYRKFKKELKMEEYLESEDSKGRRLMARLRSGTNNLRIETGRRNGLTREERRCWFGCDYIEDEEHFLQKCWLYDDIRNDWVNEVGERALKQEGLALMTGTGSKSETKAAIKYINRAVAKRRRILELMGRGGQI